MTDPYRQPDPPLATPTKIYSVRIERRTEVSLDVEAVDEAEARRYAEKHIETFYRQGVVAQTSIRWIDVMYEGEEDVRKYKEMTEKTRQQIERSRSQGSDTR